MLSRRIKPEQQIVDKGETTLLPKNDMIAQAGHTGAAPKKPSALHVVSDPTGSRARTVNESGWQIS